MFAKDDIVVIAVDHPAGAESTYSKGCVGIVTDVTKFDNLVYYQVCWRFERTGFIFIENELRLATPDEIRTELTDILLRRYLKD